MPSLHSNAVCVLLLKVQRSLGGEQMTKCIKAIPTQMVGLYMLPISVDTKGRVAFCLYFTHYFSCSDTCSIGIAFDIDNPYHLTG